MKKDMFYNYDNNIKKKKYPAVHTHEYIPKELIGDTSMQLIRNIKGDILGVGVKKGNPIELRFDLAGCINGSNKLSDFISDVSLSILNTCHEPVLELTPNSISMLTDDCIYFKFTDDKNILVPDLYKMILKVAIDDEYYTLFSESDGFLEIM